MADKRFVTARAGIMQIACMKISSGTALSVNQYADIRLRDHARLFKQSQYQRNTVTIALRQLSSVAGAGLSQRFIYRFYITRPLSTASVKAEYALW